MKKTILGILLALIVTFSLSPISYATEDDDIEWEDEDFDEDDEYIEDDEDELPTATLINEPLPGYIGEIVEEYNENDETVTENEPENTPTDTPPAVSETTPAPEEEPETPPQNVTNDTPVEDSPLNVTVYTDTTGVEYLVFEYNGAIAVIKREQNILPPEVREELIKNAKDI